MKLDVQDSKKIRLELIIQSLDFISNLPPISQYDLNNSFKKKINEMISEFKSKGFTDELYQIVNQFFYENSDVISLFTSVHTINQGAAPSLDSIEKIVKRHKTNCYG